MISESTELGDRYLKVNHAGEHGAVQIYRGQITVARWRCPAVVDSLEALKAHEERHRRIFATELSARGRRRCRSYHLCGLGGYLLGVLTGLCGARAIGATTVAVEQVVLKHLERQIADVATTDPGAHAAIAAIVRDEQSHHAEGVRLLGASSIWMAILMPLVAASTTMVIWLGMRF